MNRAQTIPNNSRVGVLTFDILSEGNVIPPTFQVISISVEKTVNRIPTAEILLRDGDFTEGKFDVSDNDFFKPGKELEIKIGYDSNNETVFKGVVIKQRIQVKESGNSFLKIYCKDKAFAMTLGRKQRYFTEVKDSEAVEEIIGEYNLEKDVEATTVTHQELVQSYAIDWDFILSRAEANGRVVLVNDGKVSVKKPQTSGSTDLELALGGNLLRFDAELDASQQWKSVTAKAWDHSSQDFFEADSSSIDFTENGNLTGETLADVGQLSSYDLVHSGFLNEEELKAWADACLLKSRLSKICGTAGFVGYTPLIPGQLVELQGVGERFNGVVYLTGVRYEARDGSCFMDIQFGLSNEWFYEKHEINERPGAGLLPAIHGLQVGVVKQLEGDPEGHERILVYLPTLAADGDGTWARLASLDAGDQRGWVTRPEIEDEVIVGFINDDAREAVVLGQLHSAAKPAPIPATDDNHIKGYTTRSEMKVEFDDDKKIITISTPAGNSMIMSEEDTSITIEDQNGNSCVMDSDGITMKSSKDINIEAPGKINIKATQDLSIEGLNVNAKASAALKAEGSASAELSSGGQTAVKGSMLMLN